MIRQIINTSIIIFVMVSLSSCIKKDEFPIIPYIEFDSFTKINNTMGYDDKGILAITFTDGDGDVGLHPNETSPPYDTSNIYYYNFFITYYEMQNGELIEVELPFTNNARIPILNTSDKEKPLKGKIEIELFFNNYTSPFDTIRFDAFIVDRALNHSNTISTFDIIVVK
ncbi:hypothetical protein ACFLRZ_03500 [Bacteroidota bacterium]